MLAAVEGAEPQLTHDMKGSLTSHSQTLFVRICTPARWCMFYEAATLFNIITSIMTITIAFIT